MKLENQEFGLGESGVVDFNVSRLPSGTRINITAHVIRSKKEGPTVLVLGGVHGDEINGVQIVRRLLSSGRMDQLQIGSVILVPLLNVYGFINFDRDVPDGKDVNRSFPGSSSGSLASRVASVLTKKILPVVDYAIDLHTGGASRYNYPQLRFASKDATAIEMASAFASHYLIQKSGIPKSFRRTANDMGIPTVVYEGGEAQRLCGLSIETGFNGVLRTLKWLNMLNHAPQHPHAPINIHKTTWVRAKEAGLFTWFRSSGTRIVKGDKLGEIHSPQGDRVKKIISKYSGYIIGHNNASVVHYGDALFHIGYEYG